MKVLLDTCALLWLAAEPRRLSRRAADCLRDPGTDLLLSHASVWEILLKWKSGKLQLPSPPRYWVDGQMSHWGIEELPLDLGALYRTVELPDHHHDPFDRVLVAQAIAHHLAIVTPDPWIAKYPVQIVW